MGMLPQAQAEETIVVTWNEATLQAIRDTHPGPPIVARMLAITHTCMYDAWAAYDSVAVGTRLGGTLRQPMSERNLENKTKNQKKAMSFAAYRALVDLFPVDLFPTEQAKFNIVMGQLGYDPTDTSTDPSTASGVGNVACKAVLDFRHNDGSNQLGNLHTGPYSDYTNYAPVIGDPNHWQPLTINGVTQKFIAPHWGNVKPFALTGPDQFSPKEPNFWPKDAAQYVKQAQQVLNYSANLTDREKVIAEYWADGPSSELPPGHWALFAEFISARDHHTIDQDVKMFFAMTNAVLDASISSWHFKRFYDYVRPVSAIHFLFKDQQVRAWGGVPGSGTLLIDGPEWKPYQASTIVTPPFAEYVSGHSIFSASAARVLKLFTGSDRFGHSVTIPAGQSFVEPGLVPASDLTLRWRTFSDAADEAGISRRYGGIHFIDGDLQARKMGRKIGKQAWRKALTYFHGTAGTPLDDNRRGYVEDEEDRNDRDDRD
jgi:hypothetical protein